MPMLSSDAVNSRRMGDCWRQGEIWKPSLSFLTRVGWCTMNLFFWDEPLTPFSTKNFLNACTELSKEATGDFRTLEAQPRQHSSPPDLRWIDYLARIAVANLLQSAYSLDQSPADFGLFSIQLQGHFSKIIYNKYFFRLYNISYKLNMSNVIYAQNFNLISIFLQTLTRVN